MRTLIKKLFYKYTQFIKFGIVGISNTAISYIVYVCTIRVLQLYHLSWDYITANLVSFFLTVLWSFYWNSKFVFNVNKKVHKNTNILVILIKTYIAYSSTGILLTNILSYVWIEILNISKYIAPLINLSVTVPVNYILNKNWAFSAIEKDFNTRETFIELYKNFKELIETHDETFDHASLNSIPFTAFLFSNCIKQDIDMVLSLTKENAPIRYAEGIIRNICEQTIEFLYLYHNPSLLPEYYGTNRTEDELNAITQGPDMIMAFRRLIGDKRYSSGRNIRDMAISIGEETGTDDEMSLYEAYQLISKVYHNSYREVFMELIDALASIQRREASHDEATDLDFLILNVVLTKFMKAYREIIEGETDG